MSESLPVEKRLIKIVIPDAGPINTLAAAGLLHFFLAPKNVTMVVIHSVFREIVSRAPELQWFLSANLDRIQIVRTSVCVDDEAKILRGEPVGKGRGDLAIADFLLNHLDDSVGNAPALIIFEDKKLIRLHDVGDVSENAHFITTPAYLRKLEAEGIIDSFDRVWRQVVDANFSADPEFCRILSTKEVEREAEQGSAIFPARRPPRLSVHP
ncbi:hypothetical protein [Ferrovum sp.]|uniref:hypothetical protein n=1 Tax=Ferrovum sp. TaxID=2609467 RepID=UPI0026185729|nr:hypothetical protein [Ferrovum sp.]